MRDYGAKKGTLHCVGCVGRGGSRRDRSCEGVLSSIDDLNSLAILLAHFIRSLLNPSVGLAVSVAPDLMSNLG